MKCFNYHNKNKTKCQRRKCRYWIDMNTSANCGLIVSNNQNKITLEDIGNIFKVTRMRICQIEKQAIKKIREFSDFKK